MGAISVFLMLRRRVSRVLSKKIRWWGNGIFGVFEYSYAKKHIFAQKSVKKAIFAPRSDPETGFWTGLGWSVSDGCTNFLQKSKIGDFITIYVKKWYFSAENTPIFCKKSVFSLQNT